MDITTPKTEIGQRLTRLKERLSEAGIEGVLLNQAVDVFYYSGTRQNSVLWVPVSGEPVLLVKKSISQAHKESVLKDIQPFPSSRELPSIFSGIKRIGLTHDVLPMQHFNFYRSILPEHEFMDISAINRELRSVKSPWELDQMRMSGHMLAEAFGKIPEYLKAGMREIDLAAEFEYRLRRLGIGGYLRIRGFNQEITGIAVSGRNGASSGCFDGPITGTGQWTAAPYGPSTEPIKENEPVVVDYGGFYNGYIVDMTRMFCIGRLDPIFENAFRVAADIQSWLIEHLIPGAICEDLFYGSLKIAADAGLAENFMGHPGELAKFVGHGVGLELDELPVLAPKFSSPLLPGQTIAIEPKFLFPGKGATGIENTYAITGQRPEKLTELSDGIVYL